MKVLNVHEIDVVNGGVTQSQILNYGAAVTAVGSAVLLGAAALGSAPLLTAGGVAFGVVSGVMWLGSAALDMGWGSGGSW